MATPSIPKLLLALHAAYLHASIVPLPFYERLHFALVSGLIQEGLMPPGAIVDVGANTGDATCFYARLDQNRTVIAMETSQYNIRLIRRQARCGHNVAIVHAGIGSHNGVMHPQGSNRDLAMQLRSSDSAFPICRLDSLFGLAPFEKVDVLQRLKGRTFAGKQLGFFHLDVEGAEEQALRGSRALIARDQPIIIAEVTPQPDNNETLAVAVTVVRMLQEMDYLVLLIDEVCGIEHFCRNALCLPRSRLGVLIKSAVLDIAVATAALRLVRKPKDLLDMPATKFTYKGAVIAKRQYRRAERLITRPTGLWNVGESLDSFSDLVAAFKW